MLLKQMGSISIPLPLSPAAKLLMDHAKLTVSYSRDWLMVVSTSSAGSSGAILLSGKENEIILFLAVGEVFGAFWSLYRNLKTWPVLFYIGALGWGSSQLVCVHPLWTLAVAVQLLSDQSSPISHVFCAPFWSSVAQELLYILNVISSCTIPKNWETDQNVC